MPDLVGRHIKEERAAGRPPPLRAGKAVPIGLIPKPHRPGKWHLITDLLSFQGNSINDAFQVDGCHMQYTSVLEAAAVIQSLGRGTLLAEMNSHQAYRMVPIHETSTSYWESSGSRRYTLTQPYLGLRSAPKIFPPFQTP